MKNKMLFIVNPCAGKLEIRSKLLDIVDLFIKCGYEVTVYITQKAGEAEKVLSRSDASYDILVCSGGDGTLNDVLNGLMQLPYKPVLGHIPAGTTNDFASSLDLPKNMLDAADVIGRGVPFPCDIGKFNKRYFSYVAAFGVFTDVPYATAQQTKNIMGRVAYLMEGVRRLPGVKSYFMHIEHDGEVLDGDFIFGMVTNTKSVAGLKLGKNFDVSLNDGLLEVLLVKKPETLAQRQLVLRNLLRQEFDSQTVIGFKCANLKISSNIAVNWTLDGEYGGDEKEIHIQSQHKAIKVMVPRKHILKL